MHPSEPAPRGRGETPTGPSLPANPLDCISEEHLSERQICAVIDGLATAAARDRRTTAAVQRFLQKAWRRDADIGVHGLIQGLKAGGLRELDCDIGPGHLQTAPSTMEAAR